VLARAEEMFSLEQFDVAKKLYERYSSNIARITDEAKKPLEPQVVATFGASLCAFKLVLQKDALLKYPDSVEQVGHRRSSVSLLCVLCMSLFGGGVGGAYSNNLLNIVSLVPWSSVGHSHRNATAFTNRAPLLVSVQRQCPHPRPRGYDDRPGLCSRGTCVCVCVCVCGITGKCFQAMR
jgi:hypothetical protein